MHIITRPFLIFAMIGSFLPLFSHPGTNLPTADVQAPKIGKIVTPEMLALAKEVKLADLYAIKDATENLLGSNQKFKSALADYAKITTQEWKLTKKQYQMFVLFLESVQRLLALSPASIVLYHIYDLEKTNILLKNGDKAALEKLNKDPRFAMFTELKAEISALAAAFAPLWKELQEADIVKVEENRTDTREEKNVSILSGEEARLVVVKNLMTWIGIFDGLMQINIDALKNKIASMPE